MTTERRYVIRQGTVKGEGLYLQHGKPDWGDRNDAIVYDECRATDVARHWVGRVVKLVNKKRPVDINVRQSSAGVDPVHQRRVHSVL